MDIFGKTKDLNKIVDERMDIVLRILQGAEVTIGNNRAWLDKHRNHGIDAIEICFDFAESLIEKLIRAHCDSGTGERHYKCIYKKIPDSEMLF